MQRLNEKMQIAAETSMVNYAFYMGATEDNIKDIEAIDPSIVAGVKVFMGSSTGNLLVNNPVALDKIFRASPTLIATHCEDDPTILNNLNKYKAKYGDDIPIKYHPAIRSAEACYKSSALAVELAIKTNANLHVLHLSTAREMDLFSAGAIEEKKITAEVCIHHLWFSDVDYETKGTHIKWNPSIKTSTDREALRNALKNKKIDIVATDHAPHLLSEKNNIYTKAPSGGPLVQHSLQAMLELSKQGIYSIEEVVEKMSHNPALRYKITDRGFIRQKYFADLVLVNPTKSYMVEESNILYKCGWSPFNGNTFSHSIDMTMVNGKIIWQNGEFTGKKDAAMSLKFER
jgi:dihydroorotase